VSITDLIQKGGVAMWPLLFLSILALSTIIERIWFWSHPEVFHFALESAADEQLSLMKRGDKILEAVIALSPLLGLLGTVLGLITSLANIQLSDLGTSSTAGVTLGISEALISTATGLIVAIFSLAFYRVFQGLWFNQARIFRKAGSDLEIIYRQRWLHQEDQQYALSANLEKPLDR